MRDPRQHCRFASHTVGHEAKGRGGGKLVKRFIPRQFIFGSRRIVPPLLFLASRVY
jgi:hypothetical protein